MRLLNFVLLVVILASSGCGNRSSVPRYELSGQVTYRGQSVPGGRILFEPDDKQGNTGSGSIAEIVNGKYETREGKGTVGGPHVVTIFGTNGKTATETYDNSLFTPYKKTLDLPREDATMDFTIPNEHH
jgi:hypothetical protein